jgi:hypothetical protein
MLSGRSQIELVVRIHFKDLNGSPSGDRFALKPDAGPLEMFLPSLQSWMEQFCDIPGQRINAFQVCALVKVAINARQTEVECLIGTSMFARSNVLNVQGRKRGVLLMPVTIFASIAGPPAHE